MEWKPTKKNKNIFLNPYRVYTVGVHVMLCAVDDALQLDYRRWFWLNTWMRCLCVVSFEIVYHSGILIVYVWLRLRANRNWRNGHYCCTHDFHGNSIVRVFRNEFQRLMQHLCRAQFSFDVALTFQHKDIRHMTRILSYLFLNQNFWEMPGKFWFSEYCAALVLI